MAINWIGVILAITCILNSIGLIALNVRVRYLEKLQGDLILKSLVEDAKYLEKTINNMKEE